MGWKKQQVHPGVWAVEVSFCLCLGLSPSTPATPLHQPSWVCAAPGALLIPEGPWEAWATEALSL